MDWEEIKAFLDKYPNIEVEQPGLYIFLTEIGWRTSYPVDMDEAEHLARFKFLGSVNANPESWVRELKHYREV